MKKPIQLLLFVFCAFIISSCTKDDDYLNEEAVNTVTDVDGNTYRTLKIGNQTWMLENLKTTKFNDGTPIEEYSANEHWNKNNRTHPFYQWASTSDLNDVVAEELPRDYYGVMYNHAAIETGKLAPIGWRVPTEQDWIELKNFITSDGHAGNEGNALKSSSGWSTSSGNGIDVYGFKGLPNGYVDAFGTPKVDGIICTWATSDTDASQLKRRVINLFDDTEILFLDQSILLGAGIRCIKE